MTEVNQAQDNSEAIRPLVGVALSKMTEEQRNAFQAKVDRATAALVTQEKGLESIRKGVVAKVDALVGKALGNLAAGVATDEAGIRLAVAGFTRADVESEALDAEMAEQQKAHAEQRRALEERLAAEKLALSNKICDKDCEIAKARAKFSEQFRSSYDIENLLDAVLCDEAQARAEAKSLAEGKKALRELQLPVPASLTI